MRVTTQSKARGTVVKDGEANEAVRVYVFVDGDVSYKDHFGGLDGLIYRVSTYSFVNFNCSVKFSPS